MIRAQAFLYEYDPDLSLLHPVEQKWIVTTDQDDRGMYWSVEMALTPDGKLFTKNIDVLAWTSLQRCDEHLIGLAEHYQHLGWRLAWQGVELVPSHDDFFVAGARAVEEWAEAVLIGFARLRISAVGIGLMPRPSVWGMYGRRAWWSGRPL
jgi:hypothetical protein